MGISTAFYHFTYNALVIATFSEVSRLFDSGGNTNLEELMLYCEKNICLIQNIRRGISADEEKEFYHQIKENEKEFFIEKIETEFHITESIKLNIETKLKLFRWKYNNLNPVIKNLKSQRDKVYSHNDAKSTENIVTYMDEYPISIKDMESLIVFSVEYLLFLIAILTDINKAKQPLNIDDWKNTLALVKLGSKYSEFDIKQEIDKILKKE